MAIFHHSESVVSRSTGRSTVQAAAYLSGERIKETRRQLTADFRNRVDSVALWEQLAPEQAPRWCSELQFWDKLESFEDQWAKGYFKKPETLEKHCTSAQIGHSVVIALPKELSIDDHRHIVREIAQKAFVSKGHVVLLALHTDAGNPHVHFLISRRTITEKGQLSPAKNRLLSTKSALLARRQLTAEVLNAALERSGIETRVDHRSFADRGIEFIPTRHEGYAARKRLKEGKPTQIRSDNECINQVNQSRAVQQPDLILHELTYHHATFSAQKAAHLIQKRVGDDPVLFAATYQVLMQRACVVGTGWGGELRYTSATYQAQETYVLRTLTQCMQKVPEVTFFKRSIEDRQGEESGDEDGTGEGWLRLLQPLKVFISSRTQEQSVSHVTLNAEQKAVVERLCQDRALQVLVGRAGSGKTTVLRAVSDRYAQAGASIIGMALSATAAGELGQAIKQSSDTLAFWLDKWDRLKATEQVLQQATSTVEKRTLLDIQKALVRYQLTAQHIVIVDEAGMVGTRQWDRVLQTIQQAGARLVMVGDDHQFAPIEADAIFREVVAQAKQVGCLHELTTIYRQKIDWMKTASYQFAQFNHYDALAAYEQHGCVVPIDNDGIHIIAEETVQRMVEYPEQIGIVMAATRAQCQQLNEVIKAKLQQAGQVNKTIYRTPAGMLSVGDTIMFLENHRGYSIHNGQRGIVERIVPLNTQHDAAALDYQLTVRPIGTEDDRLTFSTQNYTALGLGYAMTTHKAQGKTVDWAHFLVTSWTDAQAVYVGMTRHREHVKLYYDTHEFSNLKSLQKGLSRVASKDLVADYTIAPQHQAAWEVVQQYRVLGQDLAATVAEQDWSAYHALKSERIALGHRLLKEWSTHEAYSKQVGLTRDAIAIQCGLKVRPLSQAEIIARKRVTHYVEKAQTARALWYLIKQTHPGVMSRQHPEYDAWIALQTERNALARTILDNKPLHREFVMAEKRQGVSWRTLMRQAKQTVHVGMSEKGQKNAQLKHHDMPTAVGMTYASIDLIQRLTERIDEIAYDLLGAASRHPATEWRYGRHGSLSIKVAGIQKGLWSNFESGQSGGVLQLIQTYGHCRTQHDALQWGRDWLRETHGGRARAISTVQNKQKSDMIWQPLSPVPDSAPEPDTIHNRYLSRMLDRHNQHEVARYAYRNETGRLLGYTVRVEDAHGRKSVLPLTYCHNGKGLAYWRWKGLEGLRSLYYGLDQLSIYPDKPVLVVEGEKTAEAARQLVENHVVISWCGGVGAIAKIDWQPLVGRELVLWPDYDVPGQHAMTKIAQKLTVMQNEQGVLSRIKVVQVPEYFPAKWDLADALPEGTLHNVVPSLIKEATRYSGEFMAPIFTDNEMQAVAEGYKLDIALPKDCAIKSQQRYRELIETYPIDEKDKESVKHHIILSEIVKPVVTQYYCATHAPLSRQMRSEAISGCVATVLQADSERNMVLSVALKEGYALYQSQLSLDTAQLTVQQRGISDTALRLLETQKQHYYHVTGHTFPQNQQKIVLARAKQLEPLITQGHLNALAHEIVEKQSVRSVFDRDQHVTVMRAIEREFMALAPYKQSIMQVDRQLKQVAHEVGQWHQRLHHERQLGQQALRQARDSGQRDSGVMER
jgi:nucleoside-triphosphatase THEP1